MGSLDWWETALYTWQYIPTMEDLLTILSYILYMVTLCVLLVWLVKELTMGIYTGNTRLEGKLVVITGANCGIGLETARDLAARGARVILGCRSKQRGEIAVKDIIDSTGNSGVEMLELDLLSLESVRRFAQLVAARNQPLHILINNAGIADGKGLHSWAVGRSHLSKDGLEIVTQTNHLSHFLLTNLLKDKLQAAGNSRVINVSSLAGCGGKLDLNNVNHEKDSSTTMLKMNYHNSKLMNMLFTKELSKRWANIGVTSYSLHPGFVRTEIFRSFSHPDQKFISLLGYITGKDLWQGAQTTIFLACDENIETQTGSFFGDCRNWDFLLPRQAKDSSLAFQLWERSAELVQLHM